MEKQTLTKDEKAQVPVFQKEWYNIGINTDKVNKPKVVEILNRFYTAGGQIPPKKFVWGVSPYALVKEYPFLKNDYPIMGSMESYWISFYLFGQKITSPDVYDKTTSANLDLWAEIAKNCFMYWPYEKVCFVSEKPAEINMETDRDSPRVHRIGGPAIRFHDGYCLWVVRGVRVDKNISMGNFSAQDILNEQNAELQRTMIEIYGEGHFMQDINAKPVHEDRFGKLFCVNFLNDPEPLFMVQVTDSTPMSNGEYKRYWLQVSPEHFNGNSGKIAHAAVASTWRNEDGSLYFKDYLEYNPQIES